VKEQIDCLKTELLAEMTITVDSVTERVSEIEKELLKSATNLTCKHKSKTSSEKY